MDQDKSSKSPDAEAAKPSVSNQGKKQNDGQPDPFLLETIYPTATSLFAPTGVVAASSMNVIVAFDTNVLLLPYSIKQDQLSSLRNLYRKLADDNRLFVPARCVREFIKNRDSNLVDVINAINTKKSQINLPEARISPLMEGIEGYQELLSAHGELKSAKQKYLSSLDSIIKKMRSWRSDDHITSLYNEVFTSDRIIEHSEENSELLSTWRYRLVNKIPPGYKDSSKDDTGIGDFIIWSTILKLGKEKNMDLIFVTDETKADWFVRASAEAIYPRPELVYEYRQISSGRNIRLCSLHELLKELNVSDELVSEVRSAESANNAAIRALTQGSPTVYFGTRHTSIKRYDTRFDYSKNDGKITVNQDSMVFDLRFSKGDDNRIHLYKIGNVGRIARLKDISSGEAFYLNDFESSSTHYTVHTNEAFLAENSLRQTLVGRMVFIADESRGAEIDLLSFVFYVFNKGEELVAP
jgi:hypothetical protein